MKSFQILNINNQFQSKSLIKIVIILTALLFADIESRSVELSTHNNVKRQDNKKLVPTLTVDVGPQSSSIPSLVNQENTIDYYFPEQAVLFNFSCVIKHPSFRYKIQITREQELNSGAKSGPIDLIDPADMEQVNPVVKDDRMSIVFDEFVSPVDPTAKYLRASFLISNLKLGDSGIYKCMYSSLVKQIKVVVFKQAHSKNIKFPLTNYKSLELNKRTEFTCSVEDVYPKPIVTFKSPIDSDIENDQVAVEDISIKTDSVYAYSSLNKLSYTPKYTDNNKNLTCSVFSYGSSNMTVATSYQLNIEGTELVSDECKDTLHANVDEKDFIISCLFFSNPKIDPEWETKILKTSTVVVDSTATIESGIGSSQDGTTTEPLNNIITQTEEPYKILNQDDETSNYVASVEVVNTPDSGVYRAIVKIKNVREEDFKNYTMKLVSNQVLIKHIIRLRKRSEYQNQKELIMNPGPAIGSGAVNFLSEFHSKFLLFIQSALIVIIFNR